MAIEDPHPTARDGIRILREVWRTKIHLLWLIGAGAVLGAFGWV